MRIGYARVSTPDQSLHLQQDALQAAGCERLFTDVVSGARVARPGLTAALAECRLGDTLVVWKLDRLGRSLPHLVETVGDLAARGVGFQSVQEQLDTTTSGGKLIFHLFAALVEFERDLIRERTQASLAAARARGRTGGHPPGSIRRSRKPHWRSRRIVGAASGRFVKSSASRATPITNTRERRTCPAPSNRAGDPQTRSGLRANPAADSGSRWFRGDPPTF